MSNKWQQIRTEWSIWRVGALPGLGVIAIVIAARLAGWLQGVEWLALDTCLRLRPPEPTDDRIVLVTFTERDFQQLGTVPSQISDRDMAQLLNQLQSYEPAVIGLDIFRDKPHEPGHAELESLFRSTKTIIGIDQALPDRGDATVPPPPALPPDQVGFADLKLDDDGYLRRSLLAVASLNNEDCCYALSLRLAEQYLARKGFALEYGIQDPEAMRFWQSELTRFQSNSGGYIRADARGYQILLNVRSGRSPFRVFSVSQILSGKLNPEDIRGRIVLVGVAAISAKDLFASNAISGANPGLVYGLYLHAHATSQLVSAVLDGRPLLNSWADSWEYLWIVAWGLVGLSLGRFLRSFWLSALGLGIVGITLVGLSYGLILLGWWVPLVPAAIVLLVNGLGLPAAVFYRYHYLRSQIDDRQLVIDQLFSAIHNEPLQTLGNLLRKAQAEPGQPFLTELKQLDQELRTVYDSAQREIQQGEDAPDLHLYELLYKVYYATLERDFPGFKTIQVKVVQFDPIESPLALETKRSLCRFLQEALCNVGKHAIAPTRLNVTYTQENGRFVIRVEDNGKVEETGRWGDGETEFKVQNSGLGTRQAKTLANQLSGTFRRYPKQPRGTICELTWATKRFWFQKF